MMLGQQDRKNPDGRIQDHKSQDLSIVTMQMAMMTFGLLTATLGGDERGWMFLPFSHCANDRYVGL